jgi:hypothetical protein
MKLDNLWSSGGHVGGRGWRVGNTSHKITIKKLHDRSPPANYTDRATAACDCQLFADRGCHVVSVTDPYGRIVGFLYISRYFSIK